MLFPLLPLIKLSFARLGDKYIEVQQHASCEAQYALARIILEYETLLPHVIKRNSQESWFPTWLQALRKGTSVSGIQNTTRKPKPARISWLGGMSRPNAEASEPKKAGADIEGAAECTEGVVRMISDQLRRLQEEVTLLRREVRRQRTITITKD
jgi:hypothetical protein